MTTHYAEHFVPTALSSVFKAYTYVAHSKAILIHTYVDGWATGGSDLRSTTDTSDPASGTATCVSPPAHSISVERCLVMICGLWAASLVGAYTSGELLWLVDTG